MYILIPIFRWIEDKPVVKLKLLNSGRNCPNQNVLLVKVILLWLRLLKTLWLLQSSNFSIFLPVNFNLFLLLVKLTTQCYLFCIKIFSKSFTRLSNLLNQIKLVKPDLLRKCESCRDLKKIDLLDKNIPKCKYIDIGFAARAQINELKKNDVVSNVKLAFSVGWFCLSHQLWKNIWQESCWVCFCPLCFCLKIQLTLARGDRGLAEQNTDFEI